MVVIFFLEIVMRWQTREVGGSADAREYAQSHQNGV
jgi:hypothetical protein